MHVETDQRVPADRDENRKDRERNNATNTDESPAARPLPPRRHRHGASPAHGYSPTVATPQLSIGIPNFGGALAGGDWQDFLDVARAADETGIDRLVVVDHVVMGPHTDNYQWGRFPTPPEAA